MILPNEKVRKTRDYMVVKEAFKEEPEGTLECLKERLTAHAQIINLYETEAKKFLTNKIQKEQCMLGIDETMKSGKMISKWIRKLKKDYPEYDFSTYSDLIKLVESENLL